MRSIVGSRDRQGAHAVTIVACHVIVSREVAFFLGAEPPVSSTKRMA